MWRSEGDGGCGGEHDRREEVRGSRRRRKGWGQIDGEEEGVGSDGEEEGVGSDGEEEGVGSEEEGVWSDGEEKGVGSGGEEEESEGEGVMDDTVSGDTPKVLVMKAGKEELSVEGELEKERQLPKEVLEKLQQQRREMAAVVGSTRVSNGPLHWWSHYHS